MIRGVFNMRWPLLYYARRALTVDLNELLPDNPWRRRWREFRDRIAIARCGVRGHRMVALRWHRKGNYADGEWHLGCRDCPLFWIQQDTETGCIEWHT